MTVAADPALSSPFRNAGFRWLWAGQSVSAIGDQLLPVAVAVLTLDRGAGAAGLGAVFAGRALAMVSALMVGGVLADRLSRTRVMRYADAGRAATVLYLAFLLDDVSVPALAAFTFVMGAGEALSLPALQAMVPAVVGPALTQRANGLLSLSLRSAAVLGPALAGVIVVTLGVSAALLVDAGTFAISMATLLRVREPARPHVPRRSVLAEAREGVRAVRERRWVMAVLLMGSSQLVFAVAPTLVLLPIVARDHLGDGAYGTVLAAWAAGALPAALLATRWRPTRPGLVGLAGLLAFAGVPLALLHPVSLPWVLASFAIGGFGPELFLILWLSALARDVPSHLLGRVMALDQIGAMALLPLGLALTGSLVEVAGRRPVLLGGVAVVVATTVAALAVPGVAQFTTPATGEER